MSNRPVKVQRAYKYRFFPTEAQRQQLQLTFGCARWVYNWGLRKRTEAWQQEKQSLNYHTTAKMLTDVKQQAETAFLNEVSSVVLQQALRNLDAAFTNFFEKRAEYPNFKRKHGHNAARYALNAFTMKDGQITLAKHNEPLEISWSRPLPKDANAVSVTVSKDRTDRYFISILVETTVRPLKKGTTTIGIDVGLKDLAVCSDGQRLPNPRWIKKRERRLKMRQRRLSRAQKGSSNRDKARKQVAQIYAQVADARHDYWHQFTTKIIRENQAIFVEGLNVAGMLKNHCLARDISNAAWGEMFRQLEYKAAWYGREYLELDRFFPSSKLCSACGHLLVKLPLSVREWDCPNCAAHHDRDINGAVNLKLAGQHLLQTTESGARKVTPSRHQKR